MKEKRQSMVRMSAEYQRKYRKRKELERRGMDPLAAKLSVDLSPDERNLRGIALVTPETNALEDIKERLAILSRKMDEMTQRYGDLQVQVEAMLSETERIASGMKGELASIVSRVKSLAITLGEPFE